MALLCLAAAGLAGLGNGLVSCATHPTAPAATGTPVTAAQADELAHMRYANHQDGRVALRAVIGDPESGQHLTGWVDWQRHLVYVASVRGPDPGAADELIQAVPGLVAVRARPAVPAATRTSTTPAPAGSAGPTDPYPPPPAVPPVGGWRVRALGSAGSSPDDALFALLLSMTAARPDDPAALAAVGSRFLRRDEIGGVPVDVLVGPAVPPGVPMPVSPSPAPVTSPGLPAHRTPTAPRTTPVSSAPPAPATSRAGTGSAAPDQIDAERSGGPAGSPDASPTAVTFADLGGQVTYWLDGRSRVRRFQALLAADLPVRVDFDRTDRTRPVAIELLGGAAVAPRPVTTDEARLLAMLRRHDRAAGGGRVTMVLPTGDGATTTGAGWLDWRRQVAYLAVRGLAGGGTGRLLVVDRTGLATHPWSASGGGSPGAGTPGAGATGGGQDGGAAMPPQRPPTDGWTRTAWSDRGDAGGAPDLDILLVRAVSLSAGGWDDPTGFLRSASWLRTDTVGGVPVTVFEIRQPTERATPGTARLRYWVDATGMLRRLEVRTRAGAFGYLDLVPGPVPTLPDPAARS